MDLKDRKGSSRHALKKWIQEHYKNLDEASFARSFRAAINDGVEVSPLVPVGALAEFVLHSVRPLLGTRP